MSVDYQLPALPFGSSEITIVRWLQQTGTSCVAGTPLVIVVNDRVEVALPAPTNGTLDEVLINEGETTAAGTVVARLVSTQEVASTSSQITSTTLSQSVLDTRLLITPAAQRVAMALNVDLQRIVGTGPSGRIMKRDVLAVNGHVQSTQPTVEQPQQVSHTSTKTGLPDFPVFVSGASQIPYAFTAIEVDLRNITTYLTTHSERFLRHGLELSYTSCIGQALVWALLHYPLLNSIWMDSHILLRQRIHLAIGISSSDTSLTKSVIRDAQDMNLKGLSRAFTQLTERSHNGVSSTTDVQEYTFTLFSSDNTATWFSVPLPSQQHGNMLHIGQVRTNPWVVNDDRIVMVPTTLLTLVYDVRAFNSQEGDHFLNYIKYQVENFAQRSP